MSRLSDVLVALDKAKMIMHGDEQKDASLVLITTAPDMAAWIKKALQQLEHYRDDLQNTIDAWRPGRSIEARDAFIAMRDEVDALIAEAKGETK